MTVAEFIAKWRRVELKERSAAQEHFLDLCNVFEHPTPATVDPTGASFCFEKGAAKHGGGDGFADVWKRGFSGWEYNNERPPWLADCHARLDAAVAAAYGWPADLPDEAILERLLALNVEYAGRQVNP